MIIAYDVDILATGKDNFVNETSIDKESTLFITVVPMILLRLNSISVIQL